MVRYTAAGNEFESNEQNRDQSGAARSGSKAMSSVNKSSGKKSAGAFRTISEVADELGVQQHVLRFWETKFSQVKPLKRGGGRRYYRPEDIDVLKAIHDLLYDQGYTIKGVQKLFKEQGKAALVNGETKQVTASNTQERASSPAHSTAQNFDGKLKPTQRALLESTLGDLRDMRRIVKKATS